MSTSQFPTILITDDDDGHAFLIEDNLRNAGITSPILRFADGQQILDFLFCRTTEPRFRKERPHLLLLDIRMPGVDGVEVLRRLRSDPMLHKLPVIMLTTTDEPREIDRCHELGCNVYVRKPVAYPDFCDALARLGQFLPLMEFPRFNPPES